MSLVTANGHAVENDKTVTTTDIEFIFKNPFKNKCWTYLRVRPKLTFKEYQNISKDFVCKQEAFDYVKTHITLWGLWDDRLGHIVPKNEANQRRIEGYRKQLPTIKEDPPVAPAVVPPAPSVANQIAMMTATPERTRKPLDKELKAVAEECLIKNPSISYEQLQKEINWPDFSKSSFYGMRTDLRVMGRIPMGDEPNARGRAASGDTKLARQNLQTLKHDELKLFTYPQYMEKFGHRSLEAHNFRSAMKWVMAKFAISRPPRKAIDPSTHTPTILPTTLVEAPVTAKKPINAVTIMATMDLSKIPAISHAAVADLVRDLFTQIRADGNVNGTIKVNTLSDPCCIEVRRAVRFEPAQ